MNAKYEAMLHRPHHVSSTRRQMSNGERAAQFSSFRALTGYEDAIDETARKVEEKRELDEDRKAHLDEWLCYLREYGRGMPISVTYFLADAKKDGGAYCVCNGVFRRIDDLNRLLVFEDGHRISLMDVFEIEDNTEK